MIKANFKAYSTYVTDSLHQWDLNQALEVTGLNLTDAPEVHFSNANVDRAIVRQSTMEDHIVRVNIPNSLLQDPLRIYAHIGVYEGRTFKVVELVEIPVIPRKRPLDYQIEDSDGEVYSFKALENKVDRVVRDYTEIGKQYAAAVELVKEAEQTYDEAAEDARQMVEDLKEANFLLTELEVSRTKCLLELVAEKINTYDDYVGIDDRTALQFKELYPTFDELCKKSYTAEKIGFKFTYGDVLYKTCKAKHTFVADNPPSAGTETLYEKIYENLVSHELQKMPDGYKQDGNITFAEWGDPVFTNTIDEFGTVKYWFRYDDTNLYVALQADATADAFKNGYTWWSNAYFKGDSNIAYRKAYWYPKGGTAIDVSGGTASCKQNGGTITVEVAMPLSTFAVTDSAYEIRFQHFWQTGSIKVPGTVYDYPTDVFSFSIP